ncbi:hypothetical protein [Holophaga foetida]|uniref:hypothetical protein n=1 Tax=Holophaga foetida TaxID=35839 RepID=UPI0011DE16D5|nr:hypothetical protein [Holophaga foetida]
MQVSDTKVIGYFAYRSSVDVICVDVDACLIVDSEEIMNSHVRQNLAEHSGRLKIKKTRFGEIYTGLMLGAAYSFDEPSYSRFYPLALAAGLSVEKADFRQAQSSGFHFFTVRIAK